LRGGRGGSPYRVLPDVVVSPATSATAAGFEEGDVLLISYRVPAYILSYSDHDSKEAYI
jgi:hypothetical protein